jgi:hypothetical protein
MPGGSAEATLQSLGLNAAKAQQLTRWVAALTAADEDADAALDALLALSSLDVDWGSEAANGARVFLMGAGVLELLSDLICICDEDWISGEGNGEEKQQPSATFPSSSSAASTTDSASSSSHSALSAEQQLTLELCSRALNTLGSLCVFAPFRDSILEEDYCEEGLESDVVAQLQKHINPPFSMSATFSPYALDQRSAITKFPLLTAVLFWLCTPVHTSARGQAAFALSWLLPNTQIAGLFVEAGVTDALFRTLQQMLPPSASQEQEGKETDESSASSSSATTERERLSTSQENLRLYSCICLQRIGVTPYGVFGVTAQEVNKRVGIVIQLLKHAQSFNVRLLLLHMLLHAVAPKQQQPQSGAGARAASGAHLPATAPAAAAASSTAASPSLDLPSSSSRRNSPAITSTIAPFIGELRSIGPSATTTQESQMRTEGGANAGSSAVTASASQGSNEEAPEAEEDDVGELNRDPEQAVNKTAQLQGLIDAILETQETQEAQASREPPQ